MNPGIDGVVHYSMICLAGNHLHSGSRSTLLFLAATLCVLALLLGGCKRPKTYPQSTPEETVQSAVEMVKDGQARQLSRLIYAESPEMRTVLDRLGVLFGNLQALSKAAAARWPDDLAKLQAKALEDSKNESGVLAQLLSGNAPRRRGGGVGGGGPGPGGGFDPDAARSAFNALLADPYGWLERNGSRLSAVKTSDDTASVLIDGQPAIPVVGLPMRRDGDSWYVSIPSALPPLNGVWPRTSEQWAILGSLVTVLNNAVVALTRDVEGGRLGSLKELVDGLQEKAMFPAFMAFGAYGREMDVRQRVDRRVRSFTTRLRAWSKELFGAATESTSSGDAPASNIAPSLLEAIQSIAVPEIEKLVRANTPSPFDKMTRPEFEDMLTAWLKSAGLDVRLDGELTGPGIEAAVKAWSLQREKDKAARKPAG